MTPSENAQNNASGPTDSRAQPRRRTGRRLLVLLLVVLVLIGGGFGGYAYIREQMLYVYTDNAMVSGSLVQVGSINSGRVDTITVDVGAQVTHDEEIARITLPSEVSMTPNGTPLLGFRYTANQEASVRSPADGIVVARQANPGDTVAVGQTLLTLVDPHALWVQALIEETKVSRIRPGQPVQVTVDTLGQTLQGRVDSISLATAATFSLLPQNNASGNYTKVTQLVPVKIVFDYGTLPLVFGSSVEVSIRVAE